MIFGALKKPRSVFEAFFSASSAVREGFTVSVLKGVAKLMPGVAGATASVSSSASSSKYSRMVLNCSVKSVFSSSEMLILARAAICSTSSSESFFEASRIRIIEYFFEDCFKAYS